MSSIKPGTPDELAETETVETTIGGSVHAGLGVQHVLSLFHGDATYGRKGVIQRERAIKRSYVTKLQDVLVAIAKAGPIPELEEAISTGGPSTLYYHHIGQFEVKDALSEQPDIATVATLTTTVASLRLDLDCSLRFFSEGTEPDGTFLLHSGNWRFFKGKLALPMETVFQLLGRNPDGALFGTPLFLKLLGGGASL